MSFAKQLSFIKRVQKEYEQKFGSKLVIDFPATKNIEMPVPKRSGEQEYINNLLWTCLNKYGAQLENITSKRQFKCQDTNEYKAVRDFSKMVVESGWNIEYSASLINKDRSSIYYYAKSTV